MATEFRPELITKDIVYCLRSECSRSSSCLRYLAYKYAPPFRFHPIIDPRSTTTGEACSMYLIHQVQRMGRGFKQAMRQVAHGSISEFRVQMEYGLGCRKTHFYRYASGKYPLTLEQQDAVRAVFAEFGISRENLFDTYEDAYYLPY